MLFTPFGSRIPDWIHDSADHGYYMYRVVFMLVMCVIGLPFYGVTSVRRWLRDRKEKRHGAQSAPR